jgi:hypothetical protein
MLKNKKTNWNIPTFIVFIFFVGVIIFSKSITAPIISGNDSVYIFNITNCQANESSVGCNATTILFSCNIEPYQFIDYTRFMVASNYYYTSRNGSYFSLEYSKSADTHNVNEILKLEREAITDTNSNTVLAFEEVPITHTCSGYCDTSFSLVHLNCSTNDTRIVEHISSNETCSPSYNESVYCDYCTPSWELRNTGIYACTNGTRLLYYDDNLGCCGITGLTSDCVEPYGHNTNANCTVYSQDMTVKCDPNPILTDKIECFVEMNSTSNGEYSCIDYVRQGNNYLQTNPQKTQYTQTWLNPFRKQEETRESFTTVNGLANIYYTNKNILSYSSFIVGVKCKAENGNQTLLYEQTITPEYKNLDEVSARGIWGNMNATYIVGGAFILVFILILLVIGYRLVFDK